MEKILHEKLCRFQSFQDFCLSLENSPDPDYSRGHFGSQLKWYRGSLGRVTLVDFQDLISNFSSIMDVNFGLEANLDFHINKSENRDLDYRKYYTPKTKQIVARHYETDIEAFGFEF